MAIIEGYAPRIESCGAEGSTFVAGWNTFREANGGFRGEDPEAFAPLTFDPDSDFYCYLDAITLAVERGLVDEQAWPTQLFATRDDLEGFIDGLGRYQFVRIHDRWFRALCALANTGEENVISVEEMAVALTEAVAELEIPGTLDDRGAASWAAGQSGALFEH
jgi:hypothetical protein